MLGIFVIGCDTKEATSDAAISDIGVPMIADQARVVDLASEVDLAISPDLLPCTPAPLLPANRTSQFFADPQHVLEGNYGDPWVRDVNGDGKPDLLFNVRMGAQSAHLAALLGNGDGTFRLVDPAATTAARPMDAADLNGDGRRWPLTPTYMAR